ncbi:MAG: hypothetical protein L7U56_05315 [Acidimicrobiales bacterium]|nr:hypothetical protein [Acidimicrobiales bacterium]
MSKVGPTNRPGLVTMVRRAAALLSLVAAALLFAACSAPDRADGSEPFTPAVDTAPTVPASPARSMHADTYRWPKEGWFRLELDAALDLRDRQSVRWRAGAAGWWRDGRFEWWSDAPVAFGSDHRHVTHQLLVGQEALTALSARAGTFAASGAVQVATPAREESGGWMFAVSRADEGSLVVERWVIGTGAPPWDIDGPFAARS